MIFGEGGMSVLWSDLRFAVRGLMKAPGFSVAAIAALALGIGPNTAIFSAVYATLLAPLPFPEPDQLVNVSSKTPSGVRNSVSPGDYLAWKESATSFQYLEASTHGLFNLATPDEPLRVRARRVTPDGHRLRGEGVALGRDFLPGDDQPGKNRSCCSATGSGANATAPIPASSAATSVWTDGPTPSLACYRRGRLIACLRTSGCR
jgi:putative ABC transport system permease protein